MLREPRKACTYISIGLLDGRVAICGSGGNPILLMRALPHGGAQNFRALY